MLFPHDIAQGIISQAKRCAPETYTETLSSCYRDGRCGAYGLQILGELLLLADDIAHHGDYTEFSTATWKAHVYHKKSPLTPTPLP